MAPNTHVVPTEPPPPPPNKKWLGPGWPLRAAKKAGYWIVCTAYVAGVAYLILRVVGR